MIRRATLTDLPAIVGLLADDNLGQQRESPQVPLLDSYVAAFAAIDGQLVGTAFDAPRAPLWRGDDHS